MSAKLPVLSAREVCNALSKIGYEQIPGRGKGSHLFLYRDDPASGVTVPNQREVKRGTLRGILRQAGVTVEEFVGLL